MENGILALRNHANANLKLVIDFSAQISALSNSPSISNASSPLNNENNYMRNLTSFKKSMAKDLGAKI